MATGKFRDGDDARMAETAEPGAPSDVARSLGIANGRAQQQDRLVRRTAIGWKPEHLPPEHPRIAQLRLGFATQHRILLRQHEGPAAASQPGSVPVENGRACSPGAQLQRGCGDGEPRRRCQADQVGRVGEWERLVEVIDAPDQPSLAVAPGAEVLGVQVPDREHIGCAGDIRAACVPLLDPAVEGRPKERERRECHLLVLEPDVGSHQRHLACDPCLVAAGGFDDRLERRGSRHAGRYWRSRPCSCSCPEYAERNTVGLRIAFVSSAVPRRCGIATFTSDLVAALRATDSTVTCHVAAIEEPSIIRPYRSEVRWRIRQGDPQSYRAAALAINASNVDAVIVEHEFGLYGTWNDPVFVGGRWTDSAYEDHLRGFLEVLNKPVVTTMHTVLPAPSASIRQTVRNIDELSDAVIVMAVSAVAILADDYGFVGPPLVIPHGMPVIAPRGRHRFKAKLGVRGRTIISTFGLVDPRKGLEYMIAAMPRVVEAHPDALYLIAGQTHPDLLRVQGEDYRNTLIAQIHALGMDDHVAFIDQYMSQPDIIELLLATDVYVTPYLDPNQITSGTLSYALGAGKAVVSTRYVHAAEALADGRGMLVDFRDS